MSTKPNANDGFSRAPRPAEPPKTPQEFIAGAQRPQVIESGASSAPSKAGGVVNPLEFADTPRIGKMMLRTSPRENAVLEWVYANKPGVRSKHDYLLKAVQRQMEEDLATLAGSDFKFNQDDE